MGVDSFAAEVPIITTDWPWHAHEFEYLKNGHNSLIDTLSYSNQLVQLSKGCAEAGEVVTVPAMTENFLEGARRALALSRS